MRRVIVSKLVYNINLKKLIRQPDGEAYFHTWGIDWEDFNGASSQFSTAIIERDDGKVESVPVESIKFKFPDRG